MDWFIPAAIGFLYAAYSIVRVRAERQAASRRVASGGDRKASWLDAIELTILTGLEMLILLVFYLDLSWMKFFAIALPSPLRWAGILLGALGVALIGWAGEALDGEYSSVVEFKEGHRLVTSGPYARIRHPIYAGLILLNLGVALASANGIIAFVWVCGLAIVLARRIPREEKLMEARFGEAWKTWKERTGLFLPKGRG